MSSLAGCPVCGELWEHNPECPETEDIRVLEAVGVGDLTEKIAEFCRDRGISVGRSGHEQDS